MQRSLLSAGAAFVAVGLLGRAALADEGLWTFDNFPAAAVKAKYGISIDQAWLDHVQHAAIRLSTGCSASVVSPQQKLNPNTVFNISSTTDIVPGNSGSPLINAKGEVIGAIFDGNIYMLGGAFAYDGRLNRAVSVSTAAITEALEKVYQDSELVKELRATQ